jgi:hypothetical protein
VRLSPAAGLREDGAVIELLVVAVITTGATVLYWFYSVWEFRPSTAPRFYREKRSFPMPPQWVLPLALVLTNASTCLWAVAAMDAGLIASHPVTTVLIGTTLATFCLIIVPTVLFGRPRFLISPARQEEMRRGRRRWDESPEG